MCAIGGIYLKANQKIELSRYLEGMLRIQHHRGPDACGLWHDPTRSLGLCHNRLAIIDLSEAGVQPMHSVDQRYSIVFNGEIYNHRELRQQIKSNGSRFRSNSDTEVLLESYRLWGEAMLTRMRGMFSFALYDKEEGTLFCARDRIGKKPFVYAQTNQGFIFASEIPAVLQFSSIDRAYNQGAIAAMLLHNMRHIPDPHTVYCGVRRLRAGHAMLVKHGAIEKEWRYWHPEVKENVNVAELRDTLEESVAIRSVADVPVGALLSGGLDSTVVVNLMGQYANEPIKTYAFGANQDDEDLRRARIVAKNLGTNHKEFYFDASRQYEVMKSMQDVYGEPIMLLPLIHAFELSRAIYADGIKVVLNGNGADELFFGYTGHIRTAKVTWILNLLRWAQPILTRLNHPTQEF